MKKALILASFLALAALAFAASGEQVYQTYCMSCHQANGKGITGAFPPLVEEVPELIGKGDKGRAFLIDVVLFGLQGQITAGGGTFNGMMPGLGGSLKDADVAAVLTYVAKAWGNDKKLPKGFKDFTKDEVAKERGKQLTPQQVYQLWKALEAGK